MAIYTAPKSFFAGGRLCLGGYPLYDYGSTDTLYYMPFGHNLVSLYSGATWQPRTFGNLSITNSGLSGSTNYDVFLYDNAGTLTLLLTGWSSDTGRATALVLRDGVYVKDGATNYLWLGTVRTDDSGSNYFQDTETQRFVYNAYNRRRRAMRKVDTTDNWTYTTATWRQARNTAGNKLEFVCGLPDSGQDQELIVACTHARATNASNVNIASGIGLDSTSSNSATVMGGTTASGIADSFYSGWPGLGYHYLAWLEISQATGTTTWYGDAGLTYVQSGIIAEGWF